MTREKLRDYVEEQRSLDNIPYHVYSALIDGIDTLEQEPSGDLVSRQAVLDLVVANHTELNGLNVVMYSPFYKDIIQLPSVNPQPKTGHWIDMTSGYAFNDKCSECGYIVNIQFIDEYKFCPNCGARMESEE